MVAQAGKSITIPMEGIHLEADLTVPESARGLVVLAHASGTDRRRPDDAGLAGVLAEHGLGTLVVDLASEGDAPVDGSGPDVDRLARRLLGMTRWLQRREGTRELPLGYVGSGVAGAAVLRAAASRGDDVAAVVVLDGRLDLATDALPAVQAATLFVVSEGGTAALERTREAVADRSAPTEIAAIGGAGARTARTGDTKGLGDRAAAWFERQLG